MRSLEELRVEIDKLDRQLLGLFSRRQALAWEIVQAKLKLQQEIFDPRREQLKLDNCLQSDDEYLRRYGASFMSAIMELSKQEQQRLLDEQKA